MRTARRAFCRPCLDWSERRFHIGGAVGAAIATTLLERGWIERSRDTRAVLVTDTGRTALADLLGISDRALPAAA